MMRFNQVNEVITWLESQLKFRPKTDLLHMKAAYELLNLDFSHIKKIHVAGTNGKGSVCHMVTHMLGFKGYKVGLFISPYVYVFNERISINRDSISDQDLLIYGQWIYDFNVTYYETYGVYLSFFELLTCMGLKYFHDQKVDFIVMEVGIGGLLDATNILNYDVSVITSIGFDHMKQLGNTLESIASNKLGILKPKNHLITKTDPHLTDFFNHYVSHALATMNDIKEQAKDIIIHAQGISFTYLNTRFDLSLFGLYQIQNTILAVETIKYLDENVDMNSLALALKDLTLLGRFENVQTTLYPQSVFLDGAHNAHAMASLKETIISRYKDQKVNILLSILGDKDINSIIDVIKPYGKQIILTSFNDPRFMDLSMYQSHDILYIKDPLKALISFNDLNTPLIVTGSIHFIGHVKNIL